MVDKKKRKKEMKQLRQKAKSAVSRQEELQQEIKRLKKEISLRDQQIADLLRKVKKDSETGTSHIAAPKALHKIRRKGLATDQRESWKKYSYLRDRYEFYLDDDKDKSKARSLANQDLVQKFGEEFGYSEKQLIDILS